MKAGLLKFKRYIEKHIWADFLFVFVVYLTLQLASNYLRSESKSISELLFTSAGFTLFMTPFFRLTRPTEKNLGLYDMVDHVRHFKIGQRPQLKTFLESQGYTVDKNEGSVTYFKSDKDNIFSSIRTFLHESDHWVALVAKPDILDHVPDSILSIYPRKKV